MVSPSTFAPSCSEPARPGLNHERVAPDTGCAAGTYESERRRVRPRACRHLAHRAGAIGSGELRSCRPGRESVGWRRRSHVAIQRTSEQLLGRELGPVLGWRSSDVSGVGCGERQQVLPQTATLTVRPKLYLALLWHQHQPIYKDITLERPEGSYLHPWVRVHSLRDYYSMARMVGEHDRVHVTINLSGSLLWQFARLSRPRGYGPCA